MNMWVLGLGIDQIEALKTHQGFFCDLLKMLRSDLS